MMDPSMMQNMSSRDMEMLQTTQVFQQLDAVRYSKHLALETCFEKCMDPEDLRTAYRRDLDERKRNTEYAKEKSCMMTCHKKFQKGFSISVDSFRSSPLQAHVQEIVGGPSLSLAPQ
ncbi:hypothetical protein DIPPA_18022 [Diplonema papillatum]|nr:hypothetical protein DIPPA_18022 [Diplonema papillatum]|eukprot:gene18235-28098_t